jgi:hypothetical protein
MAVIDPAAAQVMELASELMEARAVIARQRRQMWALAAALRTQQLAVSTLSDVLDALLADD